METSSLSLFLMTLPAAEPGQNPAPDPGGSSFAAVLQGLLPAAGEGGGLAAGTGGQEEAPAGAAWPQEGDEGPSPDPEQAALAAALAGGPVLPAVLPEALAAGAAAAGTIRSALPGAEPADPAAPGTPALPAWLPPGLPEQERQGQPGVAATVSGSEPGSAAVAAETTATVPAAGSSKSKATPGQPAVPGFLAGLSDEMADLVAHFREQLLAGEADWLLPPGQAAAAGDGAAWGLGLAQRQVALQQLAARLPAGSPLAEPLLALTARLLPPQAQAAGSGVDLPSLVGVTPGSPEQGAAAPAPLPAAAAETPPPAALPAAALAGSGLVDAIVGQFVQQLDAAQPSPGVWTVKIQDQALVTQLAQDAGLPAAAAQALAARLTAAGGRLPVAKLLAGLRQALAVHGPERPVLGLEAELPLLEGILQRLGVEAPALAELAQEASLGDGHVDLLRWSRGLAPLLAEVARREQPAADPALPPQPGAPETAGPAPLTLSRGETAALVEVLERLGMPAGQGRLLMPETVTGEPMALDGTRLDALVRSALAAADSVRPQADPQAVVADLAVLAAGTELDPLAPSWRPLVQETRQAVLDTVQELATGESAQRSATAPPGQPGPATAPVPAAGTPPDSPTPPPAQGKSLPPATAAAAADQPAAILQDSADPAIEPRPRPAAPTAVAVDSGEAPAQPASPEPQPGPAAEAARPATPRTALALAQVERVAEQIRSGLARAIHGQEHRLVLKLVPAELGEVRIDVAVQDDHVRIAFGLESTRVKEIIDASLGQFKEHLAQQGLVLDECTAFVSQDQGKAAGDRLPGRRPKRAGRARAAAAEPVPPQPLRPYGQKSGAISVLV
ncbi:MAG: flagellar hook-length control protein FliK [Thermodesulfobacteriota bacterium]